MPTPRLILASGSPQRRQLLLEAGYQFDVVPPRDEVECGICSTGGPAALVAELAVAKALDGVSIYNSDGMLIGRIDLPERCANLCFGGRYRNRLFMVASTSVYSLYVNVQGAAGG